MVDRVATASALTPAGWAFSALAIEVFRLNRALLDAGDGVAAPAGLTSARWQVMGVIPPEGASAAQIARSMGLTRQSVRETALALAEDGLVRFVDNESDRRAALVLLTPRGKRALEQVEKRHVRWANALGEALGAAMLQSAAHGLAQVVAQLEQS